MDKRKSFIVVANSWLAKNNLHGPHAFLRFVILAFVQRLNEVTDEFVFKGGNLLWLYIKTPRSTVDVDFATKTLSTHFDVKKKLEAACHHDKKGIQFFVQSFKEVNHQDELGAAVTMRYLTPEGQKNTFDLDVVYAIPTSTTKIQSPLAEAESINVATMENIIADKLSACHRFRSGNTRMKDFDDLWRISVFAPNPVEWNRLKDILHSRTIKGSLETTWINPQLTRSWLAHCHRNKGLPTELTEVIQTINSWLTSGLEE